MTLIILRGAMVIQRNDILISLLNGDLPVSDAGTPEQPSPSKSARVLSPPHMPTSPIYQAIFHADESPLAALSFSR